MAGRPRCANCRKAFTPNYRNRTKTKTRQRVCRDCGLLIGHRLAMRRYRAGLAALERKPMRSSPVAARENRQQSPPVDSCSREPKVVPAPPGASPEIAGRVGQHLAEIARLVVGPGGGDGCGPLRPLLMGILGKSSPPGV